MSVGIASLSAEAASALHALTDTANRAVAHVPSSAIAPMDLNLLDRAGQEDVPESVPTGREEEAIGVVGAMNLVGYRSVVLMQDNGIGNALTAIATWAGAYDLPLPIFANSRGGSGEHLDDPCDQRPGGGAPSSARRAGLRPGLPRHTGRLARGVRRGDRSCLDDPGRSSSS